ncbi:hypothetical protein [Jiangella asiatica]|uniref:DUF3168 domain-containing protein n=1 Tax=Jiangella asiatica TaxID=2530372 RepID=A0A4R5CIG8_9ACTN|nr:hypothetical protein [Jiangella asiatica]TDD98899.1 hypothetical protein E1269_28250 [Jiangella asiatica]
MNVREAAEAIEAALAAVPNLRVTRDPGASLDPPAAVIMPPRLTWETGCTEPTAATFLVYLTQRFDDRSIENLWDLVPVAAAAIDEGTDFAVVTIALPGTYQVGNADLPAYELTVEADL